MGKSARILFTPLQGAGHINCGIGLAQTLRDRGHQVVYVLDTAHQQLVTRYGFETKLIDNPILKSYAMNEWESQMILNINFMDKRDIKWGLRNIANIFLNINTIRKWIHEVFAHFFYKDKELNKIIEEYDPDLIVIDDVFCYPSLLYSGKPWIFLCSGNPLYFYNDPELPRCTYPGTENFTNQEKSIFISILHTIIAYTNRVLFFMRGYGFKLEKRFLPQSPYFNIYCYPKELDYHHGNKQFKNLFRIDTPLRKVDLIKTNLTGINDNLLNFITARGDSKLIYIGLGSYVSANVGYMKNLIKIVSKSRHRFIVSKGIYHDQYELGANMWGDKYLPQRQILPEVDLVITHGGNNTVVESFTFGKPMIIIPVIIDQLDNARRIHELGYGIHIDLHCEDLEHRLLDAIETLVNDNVLKEKLSKISERIKESDCLETAAKMIENII